MQAELFNNSDKHRYFYNSKDNLNIIIAQR